MFDYLGGFNTSKIIEAGVMVAKTPLFSISVVDATGTAMPFDIVQSWNTDHTVYIDNSSVNIQEVKNYHEFVIRIPAAALSIRRRYYVVSDAELEYRDSDERLFTLGTTKDDVTVAISFPDPNDEDKNDPYDMPPEDFTWFDFNRIDDHRVEFVLLDREREYIYLPVAWIDGITDHILDYESAAEVFTWII